MNADTELFTQGINDWKLIDIKTDSQLFDQEFNDQIEFETETKPLLCFSCNLEFFSYSQYHHHLLQHVSLPSLVLTPIHNNLLGRLLAGKTVRKRPGPKSKTFTESLPPEHPHSPLKLTIKRLSTCHEHAFEVVSKKKGRVKVCAAMDEMIQEGQGGTPPHSRTPSPTPSDILRPEVNAASHRSSWESLAISFGFLAPEALDSPAEQDPTSEAPPAVNGDGPTEESERQEDSGASSTSVSESSLPPTSEPPTPQDEEALLENGTSEMDSEPDNQKNAEQESSDSSCEKDESEKDFPGFDRLSDATPGFDRLSDATSPPPPPPNVVRILAPSDLNSSIVNGSLPSEPLDSNTVSETFSSLDNESVISTPPPAAPVREGLTVLSPAALGVTSGGSVNLLNLNNSNNDPLGLLRSFIEPDPTNYMLEPCEVCGDRSENLEQHRAAMGHYKCHMSPDCAIVLFTSASDLSNHQQVTHGILPVPAIITPPPPQQQSLQQLAQQVQRLPVPYGVPAGIGTPPPAVSPSFQQQCSSPGYRIPGPITLCYPPPPGQTPPFQGGIQARPFAMQTSPSTIRPDGSPVSSPALPAGLGRSISISPSIKPTLKRTTSSPAVETHKRSRAESPDCELVEVQQKMPNLPSSISLTVRGSNDTPVQDRVRNKESSGVANILASRGITVTPTITKAQAGQSPRAQLSTSPVTTLNLSSAVSIVPASQARSQFAVPQGRGRQVERTVVKPPTVDLTQDTPPSLNRRNRPPRFPCQVCDKVFTSQETLNQHLTTHRSPGKLPYKCTLCNAQYPTQQGLQQHKQTYHKEAQGSEMALPVVDIKHPSTIQKLSSLGIRHCLVLSQLGNSTGGVFGIPIVAIDNARNPAICNLGALGASNVLSLGPAKALR